MQRDAAKRSLVILTKNEIEGARVLFPRLPLAQVDECMVVDGGSTDGTIQFSQDWDIPVVVQPAPGRGEAFRIAAREARGDNLVFFSPDGNEDPEDIPKLFHLLEEGYDMAIASRFLPGGRFEDETPMVPLRYLANRALTLIVRLLWGGKVTDSINGYRGVKRESFLKLGTDAQGFVIEFQMTIRALKLRQRVAEIPTIEGPRIGGRSTAGSVSTGTKALRILFHELRLGRK